MSTTLLLTHLQNPNAGVPLQTLIAALAHHLAVDRPTPTPLAAAAVSSPFFLVYPPTHERLQGLVTAFRHAVQLKHQALVKNAEEGWSVSRAIFSKGVEGGAREWVREVLKGLQGGRAAIRLACSVGLLLGLNGLHKVDASNDKVENEIIIALAEVMDDYSLESGDWEKEFRPQLDVGFLVRANDTDDVNIADDGGHGGTFEAGSYSASGLDRLLRRRLTGVACRTYYLS
ncbi:hypothetical protein DXG03_007442 [Asterophora parasitica]|uniref:Uncharacterized protein n=1 Tax=Asterophora parasitica TaxID=117018 RepID=A0A9P7GCR5_9AGAR|nr:hypothetical protein DXG03_007442 [Asterophora parasitica]